MKGSLAAFLALLAALSANCAAEEAAPLTLSQAIESAARAGRATSPSRQLPYYALERPPRALPPGVDARRVEAMARYFDVLLVDLDESAMAARMSTAYVHSERVRQRSPDSMEAVSTSHAYLDLLSRLNAIRTRQRLSRMALADAIGTPERVPSELIDPELGGMEPPPGTDGETPASPVTSPSRELVETRLELDWLRRHERARVKARAKLSERVMDDARAKLEAGEQADLGNATASSIEAVRDARQVEYAIALARERLAPLERQARRDRN